MLNVLLLIAWKPISVSLSKDKMKTKHDDRNYSHAQVIIMT